MTYDPHSMHDGYRYLECCDRYAQPGRYHFEPAVGYVCNDGMGCMPHMAACTACGAPTGIAYDPNAYAYCADCSALGRWQHAHAVRVSAGY